MQMTLKRCSICAGRRKLMGMGGIERDCNGCQGVGYLDVPRDETLREIIKTAQDDLTADMKEKIRPIPSKQRGRPKKVYK